MPYLYLVEAGLWILVASCLGYLYITVFAHDKSALILRRFNNAIKMAYRHNSPSKSSEEILERLLIDYNNIVWHLGKSNYNSCMNALEQIVYRYDTYSDKDFRAFFKEDRDDEIHKFVCSLCKQMKECGHYFELPGKEIMIIKNLKLALDDNNVALGTTAIDLLVAEIIRRDCELKNQKQDNQFGKILSIVGIVISVIFGILSVIMYFKPLSA